MTAGGADERRDRDIDRLPSNATEPGGAPRLTEEPGGHDGGEDLPPAGPHAEPRLTNPDSTPGAGTLTPPGEHDDGDATSG